MGIARDGEITLQQASRGKESVVRRPTLQASVDISAALGKQVHPIDSSAPCPLGKVADPTELAIYRPAFVNHGVANRSGHPRHSSQVEGLAVCITPVRRRIYATGR